MNDQDGINVALQWHPVDPWSGWNLVVALPRDAKRASRKVRMARKRRRGYA